MRWCSLILYFNCYADLHSIVILNIWIFEIQSIGFEKENVGGNRTIKICTRQLECIKAEYEKSKCIENRTGRSPPDDLSVRRYHVVPEVGC